MNSADGLSFDTWGVDYGLLNKSGNLLRLPCHYRDTRTAGTVEKVLKKIPADNLYRATGNQIMEINTLFQLTTEDTAGAETAAVYAGLICPPPVRQYANGTHHCFHLSAAGSGQPNLADRYCQDLRH